MAKYLIVTKDGILSKSEITFECTDEKINKWSAIDRNVQVFAREGVYCGPDGLSLFFECEAFRNCVAVIVTDGQSVGDPDGQREFAIYTPI